MLPGCTTQCSCELSASCPLLLPPHPSRNPHVCSFPSHVCSHVPRVRVPNIKWEATSRRVITMEWIDGVKLTDEKGEEHVAMQCAFGWWGGGAWRVCADHRGAA